MIKTLSVCAGLALLVSACGSDGGSSIDQSPTGLPTELPTELPAELLTELPAELQGIWVSDACVIVDQTQSLSESIAFSGSTMTRTLIRYTASTDCSDKLTISRHFVADVEVPGGATAEGAENEISINYTRGYITAPGETKARLQERGTPLQDLLAPQGITDLDNIPVASFVDSEVVQPTYQVSGGVLRFGGSSPQSDGSSQLLRPDIFAGTEFTRPVVEPGCAVVGSANQNVSVLLVGNSLMNGVQSNLERLLKCGGYTTDLGTSNPGGNFLYQHLENPRTTSLIEQGFDLTLIQEQSRSIATHTPPYDIINAMKDKIEAAGSEMGFYQTWGYQNREIELTNEILFGYENLAATFNAPIVHIGRAWDQFYNKHNDAPPFSLYVDYAHSTPHGRALIAYVLYAYLTGESPVNLSSLSLADEEALELQNVAWLIHQSNL